MAVDRNDSSRLNREISAPKYGLHLDCFWLSSRFADHVLEFRQHCPSTMLGSANIWRLAVLVGCAQHLFRSEADGCVQS